MKAGALALLLAAVPAPLLAGPDWAGLVEERLGALTDLYKRLHARPELSFQEKRTSAAVARGLREAGARVTAPFGRYADGRPAQGVVGVLENGPGPVLLLRADFDALPVEEKTGLPYASAVRARDASGEAVPVMHACGHDLHASVLVGAAQVLGRLRGRFRGTVVFVGQPAEEVGEGSHALLDAGLYEKFPKPDFVFALHASPYQPAGVVGFKPGHALASIDTVDLLVRGKGGHGAWPQHAKDPVVLAAQTVLALQTIVSREISPLDPAVLSVGSIHGGTKHNLIPDEVRLQLTVRTYKDETRRRILGAIERIARGQAAAAGLPEELHPVMTLKERPTPSVYNDPALSARLARAFSGLLGEGNVVETEAFMGGEDFSRYALGGEIPSAMFWLGAVDPELFEKSRREKAPLPPLHSSRFAPAPEPSLRAGVSVMTAAALELLGK